MRPHPYRASAQNDWLRLLMILAILLPLMILFFLPGVGLMLGMVWFWLLLVISFLMMWTLLGIPREAVATAPYVATPVPPPLSRAPAPEEVPPAIHEVMDVRVALAEDDMGGRGAARREYSARAGAVLGGTSICARDHGDSGMP